MHLLFFLVDEIPGHSLNERFLESKKRRNTGQQPGTRGALRVAGQLQDKLLVNHGSTAVCFPLPVCMGIPLLVLAQRCAEAYEAPKASVY